MTRYRKALVAALTAAVVAAGQGLLVGPAAKLVAVAAAVAGVYGVYATPNEPPAR